MKKLQQCTLLVVIVSFSQVAIAQVNHDRGRSAWKSLELIKYLNQTNSEKTTYTVKKLKASSSLYDDGDIIDSFRVLSPRVGGGSTLSSTYLYSYRPNILVGTPVDMYRPHLLALNDFESAVIYTYDPDFPDSIHRTFNSQGLIELEDQIYYDFSSNDYTTDRSIYTYDANGRVENVDLFIRYGTTNVIPSKYTFTYSADAKYILTKYFINGSLDTKDSLVLDNGKLISKYTFGGSTVYITNYTYDNNGLLIQILEKQGNTLEYKFDQTPRIGSDYPEWWREVEYNSNGDSTINIGAFFFNNTTNVVENGIYDYIISGSSSSDSLEFFTDTDGDITHIIYRDQSGNINSTRSYYYDSTTSVINSNPIDLDVQVYPNPVTECIYIKSTFLMDGYDLYDVSGRLLETKKFNKSQNQQIDVSQLSSGLYFIEVRSNEKGQTVVIEKS